MFVLLRGDSFRSVEPIITQNVIFRNGETVIATRRRTLYRCALLKTNSFCQGCKTYCRSLLYWINIHFYMSVLNGTLRIGSNVAMYHQLFNSIPLRMYSSFVMQYSIQRKRISADNTSPLSPLDEEKSSTLWAKEWHSYSNSHSDSHDYEIWPLWWSVWHLRTGVVRYDVCLANTSVLKQLRFGLDLVLKRFCWFLW